MVSKNVDFPDFHFRVPFSCLRPIIYPFARNPSTPERIRSIWRPWQKPFALKASRSVSRGAEGLRARHIACHAIIGRSGEQLYIYDVQAHHMPIGMGQSGADAFAFVYRFQYSIIINIWKIETQLSSSRALPDHFHTHVLSQRFALYTHTHTHPEAIRGVSLGDMLIWQTPFSQARAMTQERPKWNQIKQFSFCLCAWQLKGKCKQNLLHT